MKNENLDLHQLKKKINPLGWFLAPTDLALNKLVVQAQPLSPVNIRYSVLEMTLALYRPF